jgi:hypothetical protein
LAQINSADSLDLINDYKSNLDSAAEFYLNKTDIPDEILLSLIPSNNQEFGIYYSTTYPNNELNNSGFFYSTSVIIFRRFIIDHKENFYLPSLLLASFADGEYAETFIDYLEQIISLDSVRFCESVRDKEYLKKNPIKYYFEILKCD